MENTDNSELFRGILLELWAHEVTPEQTLNEADFILEELGAEPGARLLDAACGGGRLALELSRRGCLMAGIDISEEWIAHAAGTAEDAGREIEYVRGDMAHLPWEDRAFAGAYCFGNSLSFLETAKLQQFLDSLSRVLNPGAGFVFDSTMAAESFLPSFEQRLWYQVEDLHVMLDYSYYPENNRVDTEHKFLRDGKLISHTYSQWVHSLGEFRRMLTKARLVPQKVYSSRLREPFTLGSPYLIITCKKQ